MILAIALSLAQAGLNANVLIQLFAAAAQTFTLDDVAKGILDNDLLG